MRRCIALILPLFCSVPAVAAELGVERADSVRRLAEVLTTGVELAGMAVIVLAVLAATLLFLRDGLRAGGWTEAYEHYRANLGRGILLGLELLVAADIIGTVAAPLDFRTVGALGLIVLIRTFLSFSLEVEIKGHWPWQESRMRHRAPSHDGP